MILNKFRPSYSLAKIGLIGLGTLIFIHFACNKSSGINENKAYMTVIHTAYDLDPVKITVQGDTITSNWVQFGQFSGYPINQYDTLTAGVENLELISGSKVLMHGNLSFQQGTHYSMFVYDTLNASSVNLLMLQDNFSLRTDTFTYVRFINFSPGTSYSFLFTDSTSRQIDSLGNTAPVVDTFRTAYTPFAGYNVSPGYYRFSQVRLGYYKVQIVSNYADPNSFFQLDSLHIDSLKIYNIYLQGFTGVDTGAKKLQIKSMILN